MLKVETIFYTEREKKGSCGVCKVSDFLVIRMIHVFSPIGDGEVGLWKGMGHELSKWSSDWKGK